MEPRTSRITTALAVAALLGLPVAPAAAEDDVDGPTGLTAVVSATTGRASLSWTPVSLEDAEGSSSYEVRIAPAGTDPASTLPVGQAPGPTWISAPLPPGRWAATITTVDDIEGTRSSASAPIQFTVAPPPSTTANLLTVNQASVETSSAGFEASTSGAVHSRSLAAAADGISSLSVVAKVAGRTGVMTTRGWTRIAAGRTYTATVDVRPGTVAAPRSATIRLRWWASTGRLLATTSSTWSVLPAGRFTRLAVLARPAPPGAASVSAELLVDGLLVGERVFADRWGLWQSTVLPAWSRGAASTGAFAVVLGDSYEVGSGAPAPTMRWSSLAWSQRGWREINLARGGSGYATDAGLDATCGWSGCATILGSTSAAIAARPPVVVVTGGRNDLPLLRSDPERVHRAVLATYARLRASLPSTRLVAITPMWDSSTPPEELETLAAWVREAAAASGAELVEGASAWLLGEDECVADDGIHPDDEGHRRIALRALRAGV